MEDDVRQDIREEREDEVEVGPDESPVRADDVTEAPAPPEAAGAPGVAEVDYKDRWLRAEAELQNLRRRLRRDVDEARRNAEEAALLDLVAWLDDLERAIEAAAEGGASPSWIEGVSLVLQKGREILERQGVTAIEALGQPFDPTLHDAILEVDPPAGVAPGGVVQVIQRGYRRHGRALRAARVVVARSTADGS